MNNEQDKSLQRLCASSMTPLSVFLLQSCYNDGDVLSLLALHSCSPRRTAVSDVELMLNPGITEKFQSPTLSVVWWHETHLLFVRWQLVDPPAISRR